MTKMMARTAVAIKTRNRNERTNKETQEMMKIDKKNKGKFYDYQQ